MIRAENLTKSFPGAQHPVLRNVSFSVDEGQVFTLLGPSGCGKTTSMRCVAGLETPDDGRILLGGKPVFSRQDRIDVPPARRDIGMVFQSYAIWPHMTVAENVAYPLEGRKLAAGEIGRRVAETLDQVGLGGLAARSSADLSGGQQQRVALARAIIGAPKLLLLDEPLSNLDAKLREQMRIEIARLQRSRGQTMLYVTHDQEEALALSHRIALMRAGEIVEAADPLTMFESPRHPFTAGFLGAANFVPCTLDGTTRDGERVEVETAFGRFSGLARPGESATPLLFFRPHRASPTPAPGQTALNHGSARVSDALFLGESMHVTARSGDEAITLRVSPPVSVTIGKTIGFVLDPEKNIVFAPQATAPGNRNPS